MAIHPLAGQPVPQSMLVNIPSLVAAYYTQKPDAKNPCEQIAFGTSGHRGSALNNTFNEAHILAVCQAIAEYRAKNTITGPLFLGKDTHALSEPAFLTALEVFIANDIQVMIQTGGGYTPTPVISHAILTWNAGPGAKQADGVVITPSHNPPQDGGFKYNPPHGGPAGTEVTRTIASRANTILKDVERLVRRLSVEKAKKSDKLQEFDFISHYVNDLNSIVDMQAISQAGIKIGVDPMGGSGLDYWEPIADRYGLNMELVNRRTDPTFSFMHVDRDGKIRMDCSSPFAMAGLISLKEKYDIAFANDPDFDRHGIVTSKSGLLNPNQYLAAAVDYLFSHRPHWPSTLQIGKTLVTSSMLDRVALGLGKEIYEVPVGFKWFVPGLLENWLGFGGEESAGASFLRKNGRVWTTDKDGIVMNLLAAEMTAVLHKDPGTHYQELENKYGTAFYERMEAPLNDTMRCSFGTLDTKSLADVRELAGEPVLAVQTKAGGNNADIGGIKIAAKNGWFAARPSGTENIYKIYAESFLSPEHLRTIQTQAQDLVALKLNN